eukprot:805766_1
MEEFALMSEEERDEAWADVITMLDGDEDPDVMKALREIMDAVKLLEESSESLHVAIEEQFNQAIDNSLDMLSQADWVSIYNKRDDILESLEVTGKISAEDAALYKSDDAVWEKELRSV